MCIKIAALYCVHTYIKQITYRMVILCAEIWFHGSSVWPTTPGHAVPVSVTSGRELWQVTRKSAQVKCWAPVWDISCSRVPVLLSTVRSCWTLTFLTFWDWWSRVYFHWNKKGFHFVLNNLKEPFDKVLPTLKVLSKVNKQMSFFNCI